MVKNIDLFSPLVKEKNIHPLVKRIISEKTYIPAQKIINDWAEGLLERKNESQKFIKEFQTTFNSSLWELYLNKAFKCLNLKIDYSKPSPDFHLTHESGTIVNVEAVTSNNPNNLSEEYYSSKPTIQSSNVDHLDFFGSSTIKLAGKIKDKLDIFKGTAKKKHPYCSLDHVKENAFVLAIAPFDNHLSYSQNNVAINRVLYGIEPPDSKGNIKRISEITNKNGQPIRLGIFTNNSYKEISAVIFSTTGMFGKAVVQSNIKNIVKATRYRQMGIAEFMAKEGMHMIGKSHKEISRGNDVFSIRFFHDNTVCGSDMYIYDSSLHKETHLDGLHIYYNPYADIPLRNDIFKAYEVTQNNYDQEREIMVGQHNDGSLVSRQTYTELA